MSGLPDNPLRRRLEQHRINRPIEVSTYSPSLETQFAVCNSCSANKISRWAANSDRTTPSLPDNTVPPDCSQAGREERRFTTCSQRRPATRELSFSHRSAGVTDSPFTSLVALDVYGLSLAAMILFCSAMPHASLHSQLRNLDVLPRAPASTSNHKKENEQRPISTPCSTTIE